MIEKESPITKIVVIPAYQPGNKLYTSTTALLAAGYEVVVIDDGSGSAYQEIFNQLNPQVHTLRHITNKGKGAALKTGYQYISRTFKRYVVITADADGQHHIDDIQKIEKAYSQNSGSLLLGMRCFENNNVPLRSRIGNVLTRKIFSFITKQQISDTQTGLRAFDDSLMTTMIAVPGERFEYEINVLLVCSELGVPLIEQPILTIYENNNEGSHFNPISDSWSIYKQFIKFSSSSLLAFALDFILFSLLLFLTNSWALSSSVLFANVVARITSASFNFTVNKHVIFNHKGSIAQGALQYFGLAAVILVGNTILLDYLTSTVHIAPLGAKILTEITFFSLSYIIQKNIIFAQKPSKQL